MHLWVDTSDRIKGTEEGDKFISAELPDKTTDPDGYRVLADMMMHIPCGNANPKAPCMQEGVWSKNYPKKCSDNN